MFSKRALPESVLMYTFISHLPFVNNAVSFCVLPWRVLACQYVLSLLCVKNLDTALLVDVPQTDPAGRLIHLSGASGD
jgi:hypothetical protein